LIFNQGFFAILRYFGKNFSNNKALGGNMKKFLAILLGGLLTALSVNAAEIKDAENTLRLKLKDGDVIIEMYPDVAPNHVARIKELVRQHFYDGLTFHRVIDGFMAQTGDPRGNGTGGSGKQLKAEFNKKHHGRGAVSMARAANPDSADSQFFICFKDAGFLDGQYTVWGQVISGMEFVDNIKRGTGSNGEVTNPDKIISMTVVADEQK
jgi:peptidylprolyl isomerase